MSVVSIRQNRDGAGGDSEGLLSTRSSLSYVIVVDSVDDNDQTIIQSGVLPQQFSPHPNNAYLTARRLEVRPRDNSRKVWDAIVEYSSVPIRQEEEDSQTIENPLLRPARISWSSAQYSKPVDKDINGDGIVNSAGDYFDPPPEIESSRWVATVSKNLSTVPSYLITYQDVINSDSFNIGGLTVEVGKAKTFGLQISELQVENGYAFYIFTYSLEFRKEGWALSILDQGLRQKDGSTLKDILIEDPDDADTKRPATQPVLLDGSGAPLANPTAANAVYLDFDVYDSVPFSGFLPLT